MTKLNVQRFLARENSVRNGGECLMQLMKDKFNSDESC